MACSSNNTQNTSATQEGHDSLILSFKGTITETIKEGAVGDLGNVRCGMSGVGEGNYNLPDGTRKRGLTALLSPFDREFEDITVGKGSIITVGGLDWLVLYVVNVEYDGEKHGHVALGLLPADENVEGMDKYADADVLFSDSLITNGVLHTAAQGGYAFDDQAYGVITGNDVSVYQFNNGNLELKAHTLKRGTVIEFVKSKKVWLHSPLRVIGSEKKTTYYIKNDASFFRQKFEGMRFPLEGVIRGREAYLEFFNEEIKQYDKLALPPGTRYYFVILKDGPYINIWDEQQQKDMTGLLGGEPLNILQAEDHMKIMGKYETYFKQILYGE